MGGGVFQISAKGIQDSLLIGNPQMNFLKQNYKPYVNFSIEQREIQSRDLIDFNKKFTIKFKNTADLLHKLYFCFDLPPLTPLSGTYSGWTNSIGHAIIKSIEISVGGITLSKMYGLFLEIWSELTISQNVYSSYPSTIGKFYNIPLLEQNAEFTTSYSVPLPFWFCNHISNSFPLISLYFQELTLEINLREFEDCIVYDGVTPPAEVHIINGRILAEEIYLDEPERSNVRNSEQFYLISQCQHIEAQSMPNSGISHFDVTFNHPVYELFFVIREVASDLNNDWFNFSIRNSVVNTPIEQFIENAKLVCDGVERTKELSTQILSKVNSYRYHSHATDKAIYIMPFCDNPESPNQPSGYLNFSAVDDSKLILKIKNLIPDAYLYAFALNWNWITIKEGLLFLKYWA